MRTLLLTLAMSAALVACKKDNKPAAGETAGSAAASAGSAATAAGSAAGSAGTEAAKAMEAAGSAMEAAGSAMAAAGSAAEAAQAAAAAANMAAAAVGDPNVPRPASVTDAHVKVADRLVGVMQKMSNDLQQAGKDCGKAAAAFEAAGKDLEPLKAEIEAMDKQTKKDPQAEAWFKAHYAPKIMNVLAPVMQLASTCANDPKFKEAMKRLEVLR